MQSSLLSHRRHAALAYAVKGAFWASVLYPLTFAALLLCTDRWTRRRQWQPPHVKSHAPRSYRSHWYR